MAFGKWIEGLTAETPLADAARSVLSERLEAVLFFLPLAAEKPEKDVEHVHQLRVATRRAGAAVRIFKSCLPRKERKSLKHQLRDIRRAAGEARDWDVFHEMLNEWSVKRPAKEAAGLHFLRGHALNERLRAQADLSDAGNESIDVEEVLEGIGEPKRSDPSHLGGLATPLIGELLDDFDDAVENDTGDYGHLHKIRIAGKRLRYAMEIFVDFFAPAFREEMYPAVEEMQDLLGGANDSHVTAQWLTELRENLKHFWPKDFRTCRPGLDRLLQLHRRRLPEARRKFAAWLIRWRPLRHEFEQWSQNLASLHSGNDTEPS
jgi:CHAD domain-containing protein